MATLVTGGVAWWYRSGQFGPYPRDLEILPTAKWDATAAQARADAGKAKYALAENPEGDPALDLVAEALYREAQGLFVAGYRLYPRPIWLYSIGSTHRELYRLTKKPFERRTAIQRYKQYIEAVPCKTLEEKDEHATYAARAANYIAELNP